MDRRQFVALLALPAVAHLLAACGDDAPSDASSDSTVPDGSVPDATGRASLMGTAARITTDADPAAATAAVNAFAADLYGRLIAAQPTANLVFSPASIAIALAMVSAGAAGTTLSEIDTVLHVDDPTGIHRSMNGLAATFDACNRTKDLTAEGGEGTQEVKVSITNSLWAQDGLALRSEFLDTLSAEYGAGVETVDYRADPEAARAAVNGWVAEATGDRIPELLAEGVVTADTLLTLVNAVYLKANWANEIYPQATTTEPFTTATGTVDVPMMHTGGDLPYAEGDGWQATSLAYVFGDLDMVFAVGNDTSTVLPDAATLFPQLAPRLVELSLPRFDFSTNTDLADVLGALGMPTAFTGDADFSGITADAQLFITDVVHQANITLDEKGTEAAAATALAMAGTAAPVDPPRVVTLDRPFTFWLRHIATGAVLFMGRVNDPTA